MTVERHPIACPKCGHPSVMECAHPLVILASADGPGLHGCTSPHDFGPAWRAVFSEDRQHRYVLRRDIGTLTTRDRRRRLLFICMNPSIADSEQPDPSVTRMIGYGRAGDFGILVVGNLGAYVSTDPKGLDTAADPVGPLNDAWLSLEIGLADLVVLAHGLPPKPLAGRAAKVRGLVEANGKVPHALCLTKHGAHPGHPLYLKASLRPRPIAELLAERAA